MGVDLSIAMALPEVSLFPLAFLEFFLAEKESLWTGDVRDINPFASLTVY